MNKALITGITGQALADSLGVRVFRYKDVIYYMIQWAGLGYTGKSMCGWTLHFFVRPT